MRPPPKESPLDVAAAFLAAAVLLLSLSSAALVLLFRLRSSRYRRRRRVLGLSSLWPARLLLSLFAALLALPPLLLHLLPNHIEALPPSLLCQICAVSTESFAEPSFFAVLLFLLRASTAQQSKAAGAASPPSGRATACAAFGAAFASSLPFLVLHALALGLPPDSLRRVGIPPDLVASGYAPHSDRCNHPLVGTLLLAALGAVYVPLFASACWGAVSVVINKRLRVRLYALAGAVVVALSVQVTTLALSALWSPDAVVARGLDLVAFVAVMACAASGEGILVIQPVVDAFAICEPVEPVTDDDDGAAAGRGKGSRCKRDDSCQTLEEGRCLTVQQ